MPTGPGQASSQYAPSVRSKSPVQAQETTTVDTTDPSQSTVKFTPPAFASVTTTGPNDITVYPGDTHQQFLGVGAALTDAAAYNLWQMSPAARTALLTTLFSPSQANFTFVRISFGSQDFKSSAGEYSYDDMPAGQTDPSLLNFSIAQDTKFIIPVLQQILAINPQVRVMASIWSPPTWMLSSGSIGVPPEIFNDANYDVYAKYIIKSIKAYMGYGIPIWSVNAANEPTVPTWLQFSQSEETAFIGSYLGPQLITSGLSTVRILCFDDNWTAFNAAPTRITGVLSSTNSNQYVDGVAWHAYGNSPEIMSVVRSQYPAFDHYMTEWRSLVTDTLATDMSGMAAMVCGSTRNWCRGVVLWNLALDQNGQANGFGPVTPAARRGVVTINNVSHNVTFNPEYYALYHVGHFLQPGAMHCSSTSYGQQYVVNLHQLGTTPQYPNAVISTAFVNPDGSVVLYLYNGTGQTFANSQVTGGSSITFQVIDGRTGMGFPVTMAPGELSTFVWGTYNQVFPAADPLPIAVPSAPVLTVTAGAGENSLSWTTPASAGPIMYYNILSGTLSGTETQLAQVPVGTNAYVDMIGSSGTRYYQVQAVSAPGGFGNISAEKSGTATSATAPGAPTAFTAVQFGANMALNWTASVTNGSTVTSYNVLRGTSSGTETQYATVAQGYTTYSDTSCVNGTQYFYKLTAVNATGTSAQSSEQSATVNVLTPAFDAGSSAFQANPVTTLSGNHTTGTLVHGGMILALGYSRDAAIPGTVTYAGLAMTRLATADPDVTAGTDRSVDLWYLLSPPSGTHQWTVTMTASASPLCVCAATFANVNQATPFRTAVAATGKPTDAATNSITTTGGATGDLVVEVFHVRTTSAVSATGSSQSIIVSNTAGGANYPTFITSQPGGTGSIVSSMAWTGQDYNAGIAVALPVG